jgi:hypothetical protein
MNFLVIGLGEKPELLDTKPGFLLIDDGPLADQFLKAFPRAKVFDPAVHSFNPLKGIEYKGARQFAETVYGSEGKDTLTVRNGKRSLTRLVLQTPRLDQVKRSLADEESLAMIDDLLLSPVLSRVLCQPTNFSFKAGRSIVAKIDRAELGEFDSFIIASLLVRQYGGQIIIPDFGFYARPFHASLIRERRLMAGVHTLSELEPRIRDMCLLMDKAGHRCTFEDADTLAKYAGIMPGTNAYGAFTQSAME